MTHFLDTLPLDLSNPALQQLRDTLAEAYFRDKQVEDLVRAAGISPATVDWDGPMLLVWDNVLTTARNQDKLRALIDAVRDGRDQAVAGRVAELTGPHRWWPPPTRPASRTGRTSTPRAPSGSSPRSPPC